MRKYIFLILLFIVTIACNKNASKDLSNQRKAEIREQIQATDAAWEAEILDPNDFPLPVIQTFEELEDWLEFNDNLILAHFNGGSSKPFFALDEGLMQYLANHINESERLTYKIIGHTNSAGNEKENMKLSKQRAYAVFETMINRYGLKLGQTGANGEGETNPLNENDTIEKRKANSRVELRRMNN